MIVKSTFVVVETDDGRFFQVDLTVGESARVIDLITKLHQGKVNCMEHELALERIS